MRKVLAEQADARTQQILLAPLDDASAVYRQEFMKGEVAAFRLAIELPNALVSNYTEELNDGRERAED